MANSKISALTAATTPLDGTEVLPIVKSGVTVKVANNDLRPKQIQSNATSGVMQIVGPAAAATRVMTIPDANFTAARTDAAQTFTGTQSFTSISVTGGGGIGITVQDANVKHVTSGFVVGSQYFYGTTQYGALYADSVGYEINAVANVPVVVSINNAETWRFDTSGNLVPKTAAKGVNFTANTPASGMTSQLLNWYEEGTWTPTVIPATGTITTLGTLTGRYTRTGRLVTVTVNVSVTTNGTGGGTYLRISGLPFNASADFVSYPGVGTNTGTGKTLGGGLNQSDARLYVRYYDNTYPIASGESIIFTCTYMAA